MEKRDHTSLSLSLSLPFVLAFFFLLLMHRFSFKSFFSILLCVIKILSVQRSKGGGGETCKRYSPPVTKKNIYYFDSTWLQDLIICKRYCKRYSSLSPNLTFIIDSLVTSWYDADFLSLNSKNVLPSTFSSLPPVVPLFYMKLLNSSQEWETFFTFASSPSPAGVAAADLTIHSHDITWGDDDDVDSSSAGTT